MSDTKYYTMGQEVKTTWRVQLLSKKYLSDIDKVAPLWLIELVF